MLLPRTLTGLLAAGALLTLPASPPALAVGGITSDNAKPYYSTGHNFEDHEDLRVKVLGGHVRINRRWNGKRWEWNRRWDGLRISTGETLAEYNTRTEKERAARKTNSDEGRDTSGIVGLDPVYNDLYWLSRNNMAFRRTQGTNYIWENQLRFTLHSNRGYRTFSWRNRQGDEINYDRNGRMTDYRDRNGVTVSVTRDSHQHNISTLNDHHGNTVISYRWEPLPADPSPEDDTPQYRLAQLTDRTGRKVTYHYDDTQQGRLTQITDVRGKTWRYSYNSNGELTGLTDPDGRKTTYKIDRHGKMTGKHNADGVGTDYRHRYDSANEKYYLSQTDAAGTVRESWYNRQGSEIRRDINGETRFSASVILSNNSEGVSDLVRLYRNGRGLSGRGTNRAAAGQKNLYVKAKTVTDAQGRQTHTTYDIYRNIVKLRHPDGSSIDTRWHNRYALPISRSNEKKITTAYDYDSKGNLTRLTEAQGTSEQRITEYHYDSDGNRTQKTQKGDSDTAEASWHYRYDQTGNRTEQTDPEGNTTRYSDFDALGNARTIQDANSVAANDNQRWTKTYDAAGNLLTDNTPYNQSKTYRYSDAGVLKTIEANGTLTTLTGNADGLPSRITDANGNTTLIEYDRANRPPGIIDADNHPPLPPIRQTGTAQQNHRWRRP
ncbi:hypothetical protein [Candidatus Vondammii sp. HM_W22]|uniref:hypothetical protein n=1 Tax=Candidatus Vondammii sp. HM_W22 TaxID=2687299 RepID=UPI001F138487|nr:hypothetical protein [Candidatus Vondammii sp. HM_W22]